MTGVAQPAKRAQSWSMRVGGHSILLGAVVGVTCLACAGSPPGPPSPSTTAPTTTASKTSSATAPPHPLRAVHLLLRSTTTAGVPPDATYAGGKLLSGVDFKPVVWGSALPADDMAYASWIFRSSLPPGYGLCPGFPRHPIPCPARPSPFVKFLGEYSKPGYPSTGVVTNLPDALPGLYEPAPTWVSAPLGVTRDEGDGDYPTVSDETLYRMVASWITQGIIAAPGLNSLVVLFVDPKFDVAIKEPDGTLPDVYHACLFRKNSGVSFGDMRGFHSWVYAGQNVAIAVVPMCDNQTAEQFATTVSHEIAESISDPAPTSGWANVRTDPVIEITDACNHETATIEGHEVEKFWSNQQHRCIPD